MQQNEWAPVTVPNQHSVYDSEIIIFKLLHSYPQRSAMHTYSIVISAYSVSEGENYIESPKMLLWEMVKHSWLKRSLM